MREIEKAAQRVFSALFSRPEAQTLVDYDKSEDVLYVNFLCSEPEAADFGRRFGDYIIRIKGRRVVGVTVINAIEHFDKHFEDIPYNPRFKDSNVRLCTNA